MRINGIWQACDDEVIRPVIRGEIAIGNGRWLSTWFLVDTGADCSVICADDLLRLGLTPRPSAANLAGVGGIAESVSVNTQIRLRCDDGSKASFRADFAACRDPESLDMSVLGRDITNLFAVIVDQPGATVCLVGQRHRYRIEAV
jgi:hypothetical protein